MMLFTSFVHRMRAAFRRISAATKNEMTAEDLQQEAWLVADEISKRRGRPIDFSDDEDQSLIMRSVNYRNVKRGDWTLRSAVRIDKQVDVDDGAVSLAERLQARASSDPLIAMLLRESSIDTENLLASSFSQAAAYVMVFVYFKNDRKQVCAYLVLSDGSLGRRIASAVHTVRTQPSLFDRIERISSDFMPNCGKGYAARPEQSRFSTQRAWEF